MANRQDDWEKLVHIAEEYEPDPDLGNRTVRELKCSPVKKRKRWPLYRWLSIAACGLVVIGLSVFLPVFFSSRNEIIYYSSEDIEMVDVADVAQFQEEYNLSFDFFSRDIVVTRAGKIIGLEKIAFIKQDVYYFSQAGVDAIEVYMVLLPNARFNFLENYESISDSMRVEGVEVMYETPDNNLSSECLAKFSYENVDYYMTITTSNGSTETIENYVELLLGI